MIIKVNRQSDEIHWPEVLEGVVLEVLLSEDDIKEGEGGANVDV